MKVKKQKAENSGMLSWRRQRGKKSEDQHLVRLLRRECRLYLESEAQRERLDENRVRRGFWEAERESKCRVLRCLFHGHRRQFLVRVDRERGREVVYVGELLSRSEKKDRMTDM